MIGWPPAAESPFAKIGGERIEQPDGPMRSGLGVLLLAERESTFDEDRLLADVAPLERKGLAGPED